MGQSSTHDRQDNHGPAQAGPPVSSASPLFRPFIATVVALGGAVVAYSMYELPGVPYPLGWFALAVLSIVASAFPVQLPGVPVYFSISDTFFITSALLFGPAPAAVTIAADSLVASLRRRNDLRQVLFNSTSAALALWCGATLYYMRSGHQPLRRAGVREHDRARPAGGSRARVLRAELGPDGRRDRPVEGDSNLRVLA